MGAGGRLRGRVPASGLGARGLERYARNPECLRLAALTLAGISPAQALEEYYREHQGGAHQSPFAMALGNRFEAHLFKQDAAPLIELYISEGYLPDEDIEVIHLPRRYPSSKRGAMARRRAASLSLLRERAQGRPHHAQLVIKPRLLVAVLGELHEVEPDFLFAARSDRFFRPGEIKSYSDRDGKTEEANVRGACRQAAVGVVALRQELERLGIEAAAELVAERGDLILRRVGRFRATLRPMLLRAEVFSLERALQQAPGELERILGHLDDSPELRHARDLEKIPNHFCDSCREHCALSPVCRDRARDQGSLGALGDRIRDELALAGSIERALELMRGQARPRNDDERALQLRLQRGLEAYEEVMERRLEGMEQLRAEQASAQADAAVQAKAVTQANAAMQDKLVDDRKASRIARDRGGDDER